MIYWQIPPEQPVGKYPQMGLQVEEYVNLPDFNARVEIYHNSFLSGAGHHSGYSWKIEGEGKLSVPSALGYVNKMGYDIAPVKRNILKWALRNGIQLEIKNDKERENAERIGKSDPYGGGY